MRWHLWIVVTLTGCSPGLVNGGTQYRRQRRDQRDRRDGGTATGGTGGTTVMGGAPGGGTGGTAASTSGGGTGGAPPGGGGSAGTAPCGATECLGQLCDANVNCGGAKAQCCIVGQVCAHPPSTTVAAGACVPETCVDATGASDAGDGEVRCNKECPDLCTSFGLICCPTGFCKPSC